MTVYRIQLHNGHFDHVQGMAAAITRAIEMVGAPEDTTAEEMEKHWGATITRVSASDARSVGL